MRKVKKKKVVAYKVIADREYPEYFDDIKTCVILGAGASLSSCENISNLKNSEDFSFRFPLDHNFFPLAKKLAEKDERIKELIGENSGLGRLRSWLYPESDGCEKSIGMEEFFTTVDQIHKWLYYQDRRANIELEKGSGISFLNAPFLPFSSKFDEINRLDMSAFPNRTTSLIYDTKKLFEHQRHLANYLKEGKKPDGSDEGGPEKPFASSFQSLRETFADLQADVRYLILAVLAHIDKLSEERSCTQLENYLRTEHEGEVEEGKIAFISFNYELLADRTVFRCMRDMGENKEWDPRHFYMQIFSDELIVEPPENYSPVFLKLHGSINWAYTEKEKLVCLDSKRKDGPKNPDVGELRKAKWTPAIVPPISEKLFVLQDSPLSGKLARLWTMAFDCLLRADRWVFIGYSLPPTDIPARWLFMSALAYKKQKGDLQNLKIEVYDPKAVKNNNSEDDLPLCKALSIYFEPERFCCLESRSKTPCEKHKDMGS